VKDTRRLAACKPRPATESRLGALDNPIWKNASIRSAQNTLADDPVLGDESHLVVEGKSLRKADKGLIKKWFTHLKSKAHPSAIDAAKLGPVLISACANSR